MNATIGIDDGGYLIDTKTECCILERLLHLTPAEYTQVTTVGVG